MFLGTYAPKLDDKGRVILPAKFRAELEGGVDKHGARRLKGGSKQLECALEHDGDVDLVLAHGAGGEAPES